MSSKQLLILLCHYIWVLFLLKALAPLDSPRPPCILPLVIALLLRYNQIRNVLPGVVCLYLVLQPLVGVVKIVEEQGHVGLVVLGQVAEYRVLLVD